MNHRIYVHLVLLCVVLMLQVDVSGQSRIAAPCFPDSAFLPPEPTYVPGEPFTVRFVSTAEDWPTTPSAFLWRVAYDDVDEYIQSNVDELTYTIPPPGPDYVDLSAGASGPESPDCDYWSTGYHYTTVRRFDYVPSPTPSPSPTATPCIPDVQCSDFIVSPPPDSSGNPLTVVLEHAGIEFLGLETISGFPIPTTQIDTKAYLAEGLPANSLFVWYILVPDGCGDALVCLAFFRTGAGPTPTPTPIVHDGWMLSRAEPP